MYHEHLILVRDFVSLLNLLNRKKSMNNNLLLTPMQSFCAMHFFLEQYFCETSSDSIGALLGCMHFLDDGDTADPILWIDWREIVNEAPITLIDAFSAMNVFLKIYFQATSSSNVKNMLNDIASVIENKPGKEKIWRKWMVSVNKVFE